MGIAEHRSAERDENRGHAIGLAPLLDFRDGRLRVLLRDRDRPAPARIGVQPPFRSPLVHGGRDRHRNIWRGEDSDAEDALGYEHRTVDRVGVEKMLRSAHRVRAWEVAALAELIE